MATAKEHGSGDTQKSQVYEFLSHYKCDSPIIPYSPWHKVVTVREESTLGEAFKLMIEHRILSVVVVDEEKKPVSIFGLKHFIAYMLRVFQEEDFGPHFYYQIISWVSDQPHTVRAEDFSKTRISKVFKKIDLSIDPIYVIQNTASLTDALKLMTEKKAHRILVCDEGGKPLNLLTQSRIISLLNLSGKEFNTIEKLKIGSSPVVSISDKEPTYRGFRLMNERRVSGVAVVNDAGELVGNLSISDVKLIGWNAEYWNLLGFPVKEYLHQLANHPESVIRDYNFWTIDRPQHVVLKCRPTDSLSSVIRIMSFFKVHRVYVVDPNRKPLSVISTHDIVKHVIQPNPPISS